MSLGKSDEALAYYDAKHGTRWYDTYALARLQPVVKVLEREQAARRLAVNASVRNAVDKLLDVLLGAP